VLVTLPHKVGLHRATVSVLSSNTLVGIQKCADGTKSNQKMQFIGTVFQVC